MEDAKFRMLDGKEIYIRKFEVEDSSAVLLIAHGMAEHGGRYVEFAEYLNRNNISVYIPDHRGHGKTIQSDEEYGFFSEKNGWNLVTDDLKYIYDAIKKENPKQKCFLFGHSMGSLIIRTMLIRYPEQYDGAILCGTAGELGALGPIAQIVAYLELKSKGPTGRSPLMDKLSFGGFNKKIKSPKTAYDWLTRDEDTVRAYIQDERCGGVFTASFYKEMVDATIFINDIRQIAKMSHKTPIFLIAGAEDPVGGKKAVYEILSKFNKKGISAEVAVYENGRHEILNELNKEDVYRDVSSWIEDKI